MYARPPNRSRRLLASGSEPALAWHARARGFFWAVRGRHCPGWRSRPRRPQRASPWHVGREVWAWAVRRWRPEVAEAELSTAAAGLRRGRSGARFGLGRFVGGLPGGGAGLDGRRPASPWHVEREVWAWAILGAVRRDDPPASRRALWRPSGSAASVTPRPRSPVSGRDRYRRRRLRDCGVDRAAGLGRAPSTCFRREGERGDMFDGVIATQPTARERSERDRQIRTAPSDPSARAARPARPPRRRWPRRHGPSSASLAPGAGWLAAPSPPEAALATSSGLPPRPLRDRDRRDPEGRPSC